MAKSNLTDFIIPLGVIGLGVYLAPQIKDVFSGVGSGVSTAVQGTGTGVSTAAQGLGFGVGTAGAGIGTGVSTASQGLGFGVGTAGVGLGTGLGAAGLGLGTGIGDLGESLGGSGSGLINKVGETGTSFLDIFQNTFQGTADSIDDLFSSDNSTPSNSKSNSGFSFTSLLNPLNVVNPFRGSFNLLGSAKDIVLSKFTPSSEPSKVQQGITNSNSRSKEKKNRLISSTSGGSSRRTSNVSTDKPSLSTPSNANFSSISGKSIYVAPPKRTIKSILNL